MKKPEKKELLIDLLLNLMEFTVGVVCLTMGITDLTTQTYAFTDRGDYVLIIGGTVALIVSICIAISEIITWKGK